MSRQELLEFREDLFRRIYETCHAMQHGAGVNNGELVALRTLCDVHRSASIEQAAIDENEYVLFAKRNVKEAIINLERACQGPIDWKNECCEALEHLRYAFTERGGK